MFAMRYDVICERCGATTEIVKPVNTRLPRCLECGGAQKRVWNSAPSVHYNSAGFYATDVSRFENMVGTERAAKFNKSKESAERRKREGRLTNYEKALEKIG